MTSHLLGYTILLLLWISCTAQKVRNDCGPPPRKDREELATLPGKQSYSHGEEVLYKCRPGFIKLGRIRFRCNNGNWEQDIPHVECRKKPCGHPGDIQFGSFELVKGEEFAYGARVEYRCDEGYQMLSRTNFRDCRADGWSNDVPHCEVRKCLPVEAPKNGRIIMTGVQDIDQEFLFGQVLRFECSGSFKIQGSDQIFCTAHGNWSHTIPTCVEITCQTEDIDHGRIIAPKRVYREGDRVQFSCDTGYKHAERSDATCTRNGWNARLACIDIVCFPPQVEHGTFHAKQNQYEYEDTIQTQCETGYQLQGRNPVSKCTENGWVPPPICIPKKCDYPRIENGRVSDYYESWKEYYFPRSVGQTVDYGCHRGFLATNKQEWHRATCTKSGWNPEPKCFKKCDLSLRFPHGRLIYRRSQTFVEGEEISFSCDEGYEPPNQQTTAMCTRSGWSPPPRCGMKKMCEIIPPSNGFFTTQTKYLNLNEKAIYRCRSGFTTPQGLNAGETNCREEGWKPEPKCIKTCQKPPEEDVTFSTTKSVFLLDETLPYKCKYGFETVKKTMGDIIVCTENGWNQKPECLPIQCDGFQLAHGSHSPRRGQYQLKEVVKFSCNQRYTRVGPDSAQCYHFGWSPPPPTCKEQVTPCQPPSDISDGAIIGDLHGEYQHGAKLEYECNFQFAMTGSKVIECVDGNWTPLPFCTVEKRTCGTPPDITNGHPVNSDSNLYRHGETVRYECDEHSVIAGTEEAKCLHGQWELPLCTELCPPPPQLPNAIDITETRNYKSGEEIGFRCKEHFRLEGPRKIKCEDGKWQNPPLCTDVRCGDPPAIAHGEVKNSTQKKYASGETVEYHCHDGFEMSVLSSATCENTSWSQTPTCKEKSCGEPPKIFEAAYDGVTRKRYEPGQTVTFKCIPGYAAEGPLNVTCQRGKWSKPSICENATCGNPPNVANADIVEGTADIYLPGHQVHYQCHNGFEISGSATVTCENKEWSLSPTCEDATCPPPPEIDNGQLNDDQKPRYLPQEKVRYRCSSGYSLFGPFRVTCLNKQWTELPICRDAGGRCGRPPPIENGDILGTAELEYRPGDSVRYKCQSLYNMVGSDVVRCSSGHWGEIPTCIDPCTATTEDMQQNNIQLRWTYGDKLYAKSGEPIEFSCKWGYVPHPASPPFRVTCTEGRLKYPRCVPRQTD
ncbi:complement factor H isoform X2 [Rhineura floridana]|uniref:complement factor H isoform X2 n=1 Tax=Rhineura floridana TaxID=261503 RepID=UPI002AC871AF|nr:complement factor H isoform X2 [Rhineura floridana]